MKNISEVAEVVLGGAWEMLVKTNFPATNISLAAVCVSFAIAGFSLRILGFVTGMGLSSSDYGNASEGIRRIRAKHRTSESVRKWKER